MEYNSEENSKLEKKEKSQAALARPTIKTQEQTLITYEINKIPYSREKAVD